MKLDLAKVKQEDADEKQGAEPGTLKTEGKDNNKSGSQSGKSKKVTATLTHGYDYKGETSAIGVILALRTKRFNNKVVYSTFAKKIKNYVLTNFDNAGDLVPIIEELRDTTKDVLSEEPSNLESGDEDNLVKKWLKQEQVKRYWNKLLSLKNNKQSLYGLVWGQLSSGLQESIKGEKGFNKKSSQFDCIWLLEKGKLISSSVDEKANKVFTLLKALTTMCNVRQGQNESNDSFRKRVDAVVVTVTLIGGKKMLYTPEITNASNTDKPSDDKVKEDIQRLKAMLMESLLEGIHKGRDKFPETVVEAYNLLRHISNDIFTNMTYTHQSKGNKRFLFRRNNKINNVSFAQKGQTCKIVPGNDRKIHEEIECHNCHKKGHYSNQCPYKKKVALAHFVLAQNQLELINRDWLLLDTFSTVSVFCNSELVNNIQPCQPGTGLTVITNGGSQTYKYTAETKMLPMKVHFNAHSIANILSLSEIENLPDSKLTRMDSSKERAILLHHKGQIFRFKECIDSLYYWDTKAKSKTPVTNYSFINTVAHNKQQFTKKDVEGAENARNMQAVVAWPGDTQFQKIVASNLLINSSITVDDIQRAKIIHGPAIPTLQGKTTRKKPTKVQLQKVPLPYSILKSYPNIQFYVNFFFINCIPFLHTKSSKIDFLTVQTGDNRTRKAITKGLKEVINTYEN